jgi:hypothetical protein
MRVSCFVIDAISVPILLSYFDSQEFLIYSIQ